jgi:hypothetical protein
MHPVRALLSIVLVAIGGILLFLGARDFIESRVGQAEISRDFEPAPASG